MFPLMEFRGLFVGLHFDSLLFIGTMAMLCRKLGFRESRTWVKWLGFAAAAVGLVELLVPAHPLGGAPLSWRRLALRSVLLIAAGAILWLRQSQARQYLQFRSHVRAHIDRNIRLRAAHTDAVAATQAKTEFLTSISHEIRTPLNALLAAAHHVLRMPLERVQHLQVSRITAETTRLGRILNEVLDLRRIESGQVLLQRIPFVPADVARDVCELFAARAEEKGLQLTVSCSAPPGLTITGDPRRFHQVLANLVDNGIKFTTRGSVTIELTYTPPSRPEAVALIGVGVRDTGIGITAEQRGALLAGTTTRPSTAGVSAPGMGLAIAQRVVRLMSGEITVRAVAGEGSNFAFTLPVTVVNAPESPMSTPASKFNRRHVLIVDDVAANRLMLQMFLEQQGFQADYAAGGQEAIELAARNRYDAILMDLQMPMMDGYTATRRIRAAEPTEEHAVIVAVTACGDGATRDKCLGAGMDGHFAKPLDLRKFCGDLTNLISARQARHHFPHDTPGRSVSSPLAAPAPRSGR